MLNFKKIRNYVLIILLVFLLIWPFLYILISSFKPVSEIMTQSNLFPKKPTLANYLLLLKITPLRNFPNIVKNSLLLGIATALITLVISTMAAYGVYRNRKLANSALPRALLFIYVFPTIIIAVPIYEMMAKIGLFDNPLSLIIIYVALSAPFCTWLLISFFITIPMQLEESAKIDGASAGTIFFKIVLPLTTPGLLTVGMYAFIQAWGEYLFASIFIQSSAKNTAPLGLARYTAEQYIEWGPLLAGAVVVIIPVILLFIPLSRLFIKGFTSGAVKG